MTKLKTMCRVGWALLLLTAGSAHGQILPQQPVIDAKARASDPRLETPLKFDADRIYLGEALEKISSQTGVSVSIPANDPSSGILITCHVRNLPLADFMGALWSLVGYSQATWQVASDAQQKPPTYQLLPTDSSRALPVRLHRETEQATAKLWDLFLRIAILTPKERQAYIRQLSDAMMQANDTAAKSYLSDIPVSNGTWSRIGMFTTELSASERDQLLHGATVAIPLSRMSAEHQQMMLAFWGHPYSIHDGVRTDEIADTVQFYFSSKLGAMKRMVRDLYIGIGNSGGFTSLGSMGMLELGLAPHHYEGWILPGDRKSIDLENQPVNSLPTFPDDSLWQHVPRFDKLLTQFADAQNVSYLGIIPEDANDGTTISLGKSAKQCLEDLRNSAGLMHKWRQGVLLFNFPLWFYGDEAQYPYSVVKRLRESTAHHDDGSPLTLSEIADPVVTLTDAQMMRLAKEFPQVEKNKLQRPIFDFYKKYPGILADDGLGVDLNMLDQMKQLKIMPPLAADKSLERVRISEDSPEAGKNRRLYRFQYQLNHEKEWRDIEKISIQSSESAVRPGA